ncbi:MAG: Na+:H+ antiporter, NhaA family [Pseudonocardiales bacterium]|nr:Na+:H+ antiporter, NhaA family [Pseudonocardiales bacterium]
MPRRPLFGRKMPAEAARIGEILREETVGGILLLAAAVAALVWANWPGADSYATFLNARFGVESLHARLTVAQWAGDGLLAIFFFAAGLEVKREFVAGDLSTVSKAVLPVLAAVGGMAVPALVFVLVNLDSGSGALRGWAIPSATDIAFAVAVLAVISTHLPTALRTFLLTLAVVDDLLAITIIAIFYTADFKVLPLLLALLPIAAFGGLVHRRVRSWWLLVPLAVLAWGLVHASGVHATVAGVLLAFTVPVLRSEAAGGPEAGPGLAEHFERRIRPVSAGLAVPVFALCSAGVTVGGWSGLKSSLTDRIALGIVAGLVLGKLVGIFATTYLVATFTGAELDEGLAWSDVAGLSLLGGVGFTVSLLIGELAYGTGSLRDDHAKVGVLAGSILAAILATAVLRLRNRAYRRAAL